MFCFYQSHLLPTGGSTSTNIVRNNVVVSWSMFTLFSPFAIRCRFSISPDAFHTYSCFPMFPIQGSLFNVRRAVRHSLFTDTFAIRRAIRCRFSMSPDAFHSHHIFKILCFHILCFDHGIALYKIYQSNAYDHNGLNCINEDNFPSFSVNSQCIICTRQHS